MNDDNSGGDTKVEFPAELRTTVEASGYTETTRVVYMDDGSIVETQLSEAIPPDDLTGVVCYYFKVVQHISFDDEELIRPLRSAAVFTAATRAVRATMEPCTDCGIIIIGFPSVICVAVKMQDGKSHTLLRFDPEKDKVMQELDLDEVTSLPRFVDSPDSSKDGEPVTAATDAEV